jgi:aminopeptidase N
MRSGLLRYYNTWKLKHPDKNDFIRIMEKHSGLELDWYYEYWINTTHTIDYSISNVTLAEDKAHVTLERIGVMPMPIDLEVTYDDGSTEMYHIPLDLMRGEKKLASNSNTVLMSDWPWVNQSYKLTVGKNGAKIKSIVIDPSESMADVDRKNNSYPNNNDVSFEGQPLK